MSVTDGVIVTDRSRSRGQLWFQTLKAKFLVADLVFDLSQTNSSYLVMSR